MQVPKRKTSQSKRNMRRAHDFITPRQSSRCNNCGESKLRHHICPSCGFYRGKTFSKDASSAEA